MVTARNRLVKRQMRAFLGLVGMITLLSALSACKSPPLPIAQHIRRISPVRPAPVQPALEADLVWHREELNDVHP